MRKLLITLATALLACAASGAPAHASGRDVINDCTDDEVLSKSYSQKEYKDALATLPADADQYGNCRDIIARAQDGAATKGGASKRSGGGGTSGGGSGGQGASSTPPPPPPSTAKDQLAAASDADRAAVQEARNAPEATAGPGSTVNAAKVGRAPDAGQLTDLPTPLLALLALLAAGGLALGAVRIRRFVHARRA